ncbi:MAG: hypothetical protein FWC80_04095 [Firmicutes bacterium]|nr:hypothetical protein [Bacillota bacterium]
MLYRKKIPTVDNDWLELADYKRKFGTWQTKKEWKNKRKLQAKEWRQPEDLTIQILTSEMENIKKEMERLLFKLGFKSTKVKLAMKTDCGQEEIDCYNLDDLYCTIGFIILGY